MTEDMREMLAEEMGLTYCVVSNQYASCDGECDECPDSIEFCEAMMEELNNGTD